MQFTIVLSSSKNTYFFLGRLMRLTYFASPYDLLDVDRPGKDRQFTKDCKEGLRTLDNMTYGRLLLGCSACSPFYMAVVLSPQSECIHWLVQGHMIANRSNCFPPKLHEHNVPAV